MPNGYDEIDLLAQSREQYNNKKHILLIEFFAGIGSQAKALEVMGVPFSHHKICEWAYNSIIAYNEIHIKDHTDYAKDLTRQELIDYLNGNISTNYNEPCDCTRKNDEWLRTCYNSCIATHNLMNIQNVKGRDLEFDNETLKNNQVWLFYSFPCQDISNAGLKKGFDDTSTRSGMLWEVIRILRERERERLPLPSVMIMENVPDIISSKFLGNFHKLLDILSNLGFTNYFKVMNAKDYGVPQNRKRCFVVSINNREGTGFEFPIRRRLKYHLKDFLDKQVDESYYLDDATIERISNWKSYQNPLKDITDMGGS